MADRKHWTEIFLMPLVIALVGFVGTYFITREQENSARLARHAQIQSANELAAAERQIKIIDVFAEKITNPEPRQRILALNLLRAVEPKLAEKLALAVSESETSESKVKQIAQDVAAEALKAGFGAIRFDEATITGYDWWIRTNNGGDELVVGNGANHTDAGILFTIKRDGTLMNKSRRPLLSQ